MGRKKVNGGGSTTARGLRRAGIRGNERRHQQLRGTVFSKQKTHHGVILRAEGGI